MPDSKAEFPWQIQNFRLTGFPCAGEDLSHLSWESLTGDQPERDEKRPKELVRTQAGPYLNGWLELVSAGFRMDLIYHPKHPEQVPNLSALVVGAFESEVGPLSDAIRSWLTVTEIPLNRMALGMDLLLPVQDIVIAYEVLGKLLKCLNVKPGEMRELLYKVNWRVEDEELAHLNRITAFSAVRATIRVSGAGFEEKLVSQDYAKLTLDLSTPAADDPDWKNERLRDLPSVYDKLLRLADENARIGEVLSDGS